MACSDPSLLLVFMSLAHSLPLNVGWSYDLLLMNMANVMAYQFQNLVIKG